MLEKLSNRVIEYKLILKLKFVIYINIYKSKRNERKVIDIIC